MKLKLIGLLIAGITSSSSYGALYTLNAGTGAGAAGIQTVSGQTFRNQTVAGESFATGGGTSAGAGVVAFGIFSTDDLSNLSATNLVAAFTAFGTTGSFAAAGTTGNRSVFSSAQNVQVAGSQFDNKSMYLFAGNGTTFANSTQFLVVKSAALKFLAGDDSATAPIVNTINTTNSSVLFGSVVANVQTANTDASQTAGWQMAPAVPEPSALLLGAVGALGLLRRRRN